MVELDHLNDVPFTVPSGFAFIQRVPNSTLKEYIKQMKSDSYDGRLILHEGAIVHSTACPCLKKKDKK
jgi:hypothetical protein